MATDKTAFVTGASEGLGRCFAQQLAHSGYSTVCVARNESRLKQLVEELGVKHRYLVADLSTEQGIKICADYIHQHRIHVLVNNAGYSEFGNFRDAEVERQLDIFKVNCHATMLLSHSFLKQAEKGDGLINLSSITNLLTTPTQPVYCATKCFVASFSESLWFQERERGVVVQALLPGITRTQFIQRASGLEGFKMNFLNAISQSPESVVDTSIQALQKQKGPVIVPGLHNKAMMLLLRVLPRKWVVWAMGKIGKLAE